MNGRIPIGILALCASVATAVDPIVSNIRVSQRPGSKLVDIKYDVSDSDSASLDVGVAISADDGATWVVPTSSLVDGSSSRSVGFGVGPGANRWIVWNAGTDWNGNYSDRMRFKITASDSDYLVVDLSAGPSASSYPVTHLSAVPPGGWSDVYRTTKLVLRRIPAGSFIMGSPTNALFYNGEVQHRVTLTKDFYIGVFEVTQKQWERVMGNWPSYFNNSTYRDIRPVERVSYNTIRGTSAGAGWPSSGDVDADSFMGRLRARTSRAFDLPTESQWEYAGRAETTTDLNSGSNLTSTGNCPNMSAVGRYWYNGGSGYSQAGSTSVGTAKVGSYSPNRWGLYDIHGNVEEACLDWFGAYPETATDPRGALGSNRVYRGGSWFWGACNCTVCFRWGYPQYAGVPCRHEPAR